MVRPSGQPATAVSTSSIGIRSNQAERARWRISCDPWLTKWVASTAGACFMGTYRGSAVQPTSLSLPSRTSTTTAGEPTGAARLPASALKPGQVDLKFGKTVGGCALAGHGLVDGGPEPVRGLIVL